MVIWSERIYPHSKNKKKPELEATACLASAKTNRIGVGGWFVNLYEHSGKYVTHWPRTWLTFNPSHVGSLCFAALLPSQKEKSPHLLLFSVPSFLPVSMRHSTTPKKRQLSVEEPNEQTLPLQLHWHGKRSGLHF